MITTTFTYIRRPVRGDNVYLYEVTIYRDKETGKVRQRSDYKGKEIIKDNTTTGRNPGTGSLPVRFLIQYRT